MNIRYDVEKIKAIIDNLYGLTELSMGFTDTHSNYLYKQIRQTDIICTQVQETAEGRALCSCSDMDLISRCMKEKRPVSHICHAGLLDTAVPVIKNHTVVGIIMIGRVRPNNDVVIGDSENDPQYAMMGSLSDKQMANLINLISYIIFDSAIEVDCDDVIVRALEYIDKNLASDLSIDQLCNYLYVSRNSLYKAFHSYFECTVNEYISRRRIHKAAALLRESDESVSTIATSVGIPNYTYFSRLFKKRMGVSPLKYRNKP